MIPLSPISSGETPRKILADHYKSFGGELPIRGGWGYTKDDACIIDKHDSFYNSRIQFNGAEIEHIFVEKRIYEEMIIFRPAGERFADIHWNFVEQQCINDGNRTYDRLIFQITAFSDKDFVELMNGYGHPDFNLADHEKKRQEIMTKLTREFWFDITSFYGQGVVFTDKSTGAEELLPPQNSKFINKFKKIFGID